MYLDALGISVSELMNCNNEIRRIDVSSSPVGVFREIFILFRNNGNFKDMMTCLQWIVPEEYMGNFDAEKDESFRIQMIRLLQRSLPNTEKCSKFFKYIT